MEWLPAIILLIAMGLLLIGGFIWIKLQIQNFFKNDSSNNRLEQFEKVFREEISRNRNEILQANKDNRQELALSLEKMISSQEKYFEKFSMQFEKVKETVEKRLESIQKDSNEKLEKMRETVDEKLHATLEKRLGESFKFVSDRLELVHKGLGEMQTLATGVGDLKKVLQNVKTRGTWGEVQLENLLEQFMTPDQYVKNVATKKGSADRVEFAIKFPARDEEIENIWLPIDAKFPLEDFQNLTAAEEQGDLVLAASFSKALETRIKQEAKYIKDKYLDPPYTTDFGILFLPLESLYAEVIRRPGLSDTIQREFRVILTGPTTIAAILNSLQMGFRTLAIEKRSSEVWAVLGSIKKEFTSFGDILEKTHQKLQQASNSIEKAASKSRTIQRKLGKVEELPVEVAEVLVLEEAE